MARRALVDRATLGLSATLSGCPRAGPRTSILARPVIRHPCGDVEGTGSPSAARRDRAGIGAIGRHPVPAPSPAPRICRKPATRRPSTPPPAPASRSSTSFDKPLGRQMAETRLDVLRGLDHIVARSERLAQPAVELCRRHSLSGRPPMMPLRQRSAQHPTIQAGFRVTISSGGPHLTAHSVCSRPLAGIGKVRFAAAGRTMTTTGLRDFGQSAISQIGEKVDLMTPSAIQQWPYHPQDVEYSRGDIPTNRRNMAAKAPVVS